MTPLPTFTLLGSGPLLVMLHGLCGGRLAFAPQVETFAGVGYCAVAPDLPGWGFSPPIEPYTFKGLAQSTIALIESLCLAQADGPVVLVGQGLGGMVAQEVMVRRPDLVRRLVLAATAADGAGAAEWMQRTDALLAAGCDMATLAQTVVPQWIGPGALPEGARLATHCVGQSHAATWRRALQAVQGFDRRDALAKIRVPTLLMAGEWDRHTPPDTLQQMARAIDGSRYVELPGVGHLPSLEAPDAFDARVLDFLRAPARRSARH